MFSSCPYAGALLNLGIQLLQITIKGIRRIARQHCEDVYVAAVQPHESGDRLYPEVPFC